MKKVGFIGTGGICGVHLNYLKSRDDVEIAALCDVNQENVLKRQEEYGGQIFNDFNEMLDAIVLDAVWICTPPQVRRDPLLACAEKNIPVFCEKPVERDLEQAKTISANLKEHNQKVQVGYVFRSLPLVKRLQSESADDRIHLVQSFYGCNVSLTRGLRPWFYDKKLSGGALIDQATHNLDLLRMLFGEVSVVKGVTSNPVTQKEEGYTIDEVISLSFVFENGIAGSHTHTWIGDSWRNEIVFCGEKRLYRLNLATENLVIEEGKEKKQVFTPPSTPIHNHQNVIFMEMVNTGDWSLNPCNYADGVKTLELTLSCDCESSS